MKTAMIEQMKKLTQKDIMKKMRETFKVDFTVQKNGEQKTVTIDNEKNEAIKASIIKTMQKNKC